MFWRIPILILYVALLVYHCWRVGPAYNWDLLGYLGASQMLVETDVRVIHAKTFTELKKQLPKKDYDSLTTGYFSWEISKHPDLFFRQLPFYTVKPAYPALMLLLNFAGLSLVTASLVISKAAYLGVGLIVFGWLSRHLPLALCLFFASLISSYPYLVHVASFSSPDLFSTFIILAAFFLMIEERSLRLSLGLLILSVAVRPDNLLLLVIVSVYFFSYHLDGKRWAIASAFMGLLLYASIARWAGQYPWTTLFYHSFVQRLVDPSTFISTLSFGDYLRLYLLEAQHVTRSSDSLVFFVPLSVYLLWVFRSKAGRNDLWFRMIVVNSLFMLSHWLLYPKEKDRTLEASFLLIMMGLVMAGRPTLLRLSVKLKM
jgi:hypothetical protein